MNQGSRAEQIRGAQGIAMTRAELETWLRHKLLEGPGDAVSLVRQSSLLAPAVAEMIAATRREERARIAAWLRNNPLDAGDDIAAAYELADMIEKGIPQ